MSSITIHDLDETVAKLIRARARAEGQSLNQTVKRILEEALGVKPRADKNRRHFEEFCGTWTQEQVAEFERAVADLEHVDPEDWR